MVFLLTFNELVKINKEARSLWVVGARSLVEEINLEVEGLFLLQPGRSPISLTSLSCLAGKLLSAWASSGANFHLLSWKSECPSLNFYHLYLGCASWHLADIVSSFLCDSHSVLCVLALPFRWSDFLRPLIRSYRRPVFSLLHGAPRWGNDRDVTHSWWLVRPGRSSFLLPSGHCFPF